MSICKRGSPKGSPKAEVAKLIESLKRARLRCKAKGRTGLVDIDEALASANQLEKMLTERKIPLFRVVKFLGVVKAVGKAVVDLYSSLSYLFFHRLNNAFRPNHSLA